MKKYMDFDTGVVFTEAELRKDFEDFKYESLVYDVVEDRERLRYESFEDYMDEMIRQGMEKVGGLVEVTE